MIHHGSGGDERACVTTMPICQLFILGWLRIFFASLDEVWSSDRALGSWHPIRSFRRARFRDVDGLEVLECMVPTASGYAMVCIAEWIYMGNINSTEGYLLLETPG